MSFTEPFKAPLSDGFLSPLGTEPEPVVLPTPLISIQTNASNVLFQEATGASATTPAGDTDIADTVVDALIGTQYYVSGGEGDGPVVDIENGVTVLDCAGASVLTDSTDALDGPWTLFAVVKGSNGRLLSTSSAFQSAPRIVANTWYAYNKAGTAVPICTGTTTAWHVLMIEKTPTTDEVDGSLSGRFNNGGELTIVPYNDSAASQGNIFFVQANGKPYGGHFTGSIARLDIIDGLLTSAQKTAYYNTLSSLVTTLNGA